MSRRGKRNKGGGAAGAAPVLALMNGALAKAGLPPVAYANAGDTPLSGKRAVDIKIVAPGTVWNGRLSNPDPVLRQFGTWDGICLYDRMERQFPLYAGVCNLFADRVCAIDRTWKAGDESQGKSREMRDNIVKLYRKLPDLHILNKKMVKGRFFGYAATGKADWQIDEETGVYAPRDLYDIPQKYLAFGPEGQAYRVGGFGNLYGEPIADQKSIFYFRWGSRFNPYGEGDAQQCYLPTWYMQNVRQFGMAALEILGRPIPWAEVPLELVGEDYDKFEAGLKAQYKYYVITRANTQRTTISFPSSPILANGAAGKSELEYLRWYTGEIYVCVLGVQMTQDTTGGSRALESTRLEVISDKTPPASQALDQAWTSGYSDHIWEVNEPNVPRAWYPRCDSDSSSAQVALSGTQLAAIKDVSAALVAKQMARTYAIKMLQGAGLPESWAHQMVLSTIAERDTLMQSSNDPSNRTAELETMAAAELLAAAKLEIAA